jgi:hypothetical protein
MLQEPAPIKYSFDSKFGYIASKFHITIHDSPNKFDLGIIDANLRLASRPTIVKRVV